MPAGFWQGCCSDTPSQHVGFFCSRSRPFHFRWTLCVKCILAQSSSWAVSFWLKLCHLVCHLILLIWCHLWTNYHVVLRPCPGHWWDADWHGHRTGPCRAVLTAGCQQGINHWSLNALQAGIQAVFSPTHSVHPGSISFWKAWKMLSNSVDVIAICLVSVEN